MQDFPFQPLLAQVGKDFQRGGQGVALAAGKQVIALNATGKHLRQQGLENALGTAGTHIYQVQVMCAEVTEIGPFENIIAIRKHPCQEFITDPRHRLFIVETGSNGINTNHIIQSFQSQMIFDLSSRIFFVSSGGSVPGYVTGGKTEKIRKRNKKGKATYIAPLQPPTLAAFLPWGS